jgi:hypothetical protein
MRRLAGHCLVILAVSLDACAIVEPATLATPHAHDKRATAAGTARSRTCLPVERRPTRDAFFREILTARPSEITPLFDDYTHGSYHVDKLDVADGLPAAAAACGLKLRGLLLVGPAGMLWSYHVAALIEEGDAIRVNSLVMPHARITGKGTGVIEMSEATTLLHDIERQSLVRPGRPVIQKRADGPDFSYRLLLVIYDHREPSYFHADFNEFQESAALSDLLARVNALLGKTTSTYRIGDIKRPDSATNSPPTNR